MGLGAVEGVPAGIAEGALALLGLFKTRSSIVSGTESLISLASTRPSEGEEGGISAVLRDSVTSFEVASGLASTFVKDLERVSRDRQS